MEVLGVPSVKKQPLEALKQCPEGARCSPRAPRGAKRQPQRLSVNAFKLPGEALGCLGRSKGHFWTKI